MEISKTGKVLGDHAVGYGRPPNEHKFEKGKSGNPKGRPRKKRPDAASVVTILDESIAVRQGSAVHKMPAFEASLRKLVARALNEGDIRAALEFLRLCDKYGVIAPAPEPATSGVLTIPKSWDRDEWMEMFEAYGPPPWPGKRSGLPEGQASRPDEGIDNE